MLIGRSGELRAVRYSCSRHTKIKVGAGFAERNAGTPYAYSGAHPSKPKFRHTPGKRRTLRRNPWSKLRKRKVRTSSVRRLANQNTIVWSRNSYFWPSPRDWHPPRGAAISDPLSAASSKPYRPEPAGYIAFPSWWWLRNGTMRQAI
jgi:hypothetical protein